jgi:hypothetical protein
MENLNTSTSNASDSSSNDILTERMKIEIKTCFENTVMCARSSSPKEAYDYAERMANHVIKIIEDK